MMEVSLIILASIVVVGLALYVHHRLTDEVAEDSVAQEPSDQGECCGQHITCQRDSLSPVFNEEIVYFDDEELDAFVNFVQDDFTENDIESFREVLLTLRPDEIAPWSRSVQQRGITIPDEIRDEIFVLIDESRNETAKAV